MRFTKSIAGALLLAATATATPAFAQDSTEAPEAFTITGGATVVSDYRFRGFSQTGEEATIQGSFTVTHESGLYVGVWGSGISFNNGTEIDIVGGFAKEVASGLTVDVGATAYLYPGASNTTVIEPYLALTGTVGPATIKGGLAWAWAGQDALSDESAIYAYTDAAIGIPKTPVKLKAHLGYSKSDSFLGGLDGKVFDYSIGAEASWKSLTLGVSYVNTDETSALGWKDAIGADGAVLFTLGAAF